jgi:DEAD/DEAH box helicase domain-containing protein
VIVTNPDMLHVSIIPEHAAWARFIRKLAYIVLDEAHVYKGNFGRRSAALAALAEAGPAAGQ